MLQEFLTKDITLHVRLHARVFFPRIMVLVTLVRRSLIGPLHAIEKFVSVRVISRQHASSTRKMKRPV